MNQSVNNRSGDDKMLDEYLAGDSPFSRRYRETPAHDVPPELDAKILAASKAPARRSALSRWRVWSAPVALAATLVIAVAVILRDGIEHAAVQSSDMHERAPVEVTTKQELIVPAAPPAAAAPTAVAPEPRSEADTTPAPSLTRDERTRRAKLKKEEPVVVTAHKRTASDDAASVQETVVTGSLSQTQPAAGPHDTVRPAEKSERTLEKDAREADPGKWLEYIRDLRKNNDNRAADREWKAFLKAYPDYPVPDDDPARPR